MNTLDSTNTLETMKQSTPNPDSAGQNSSSVKSKEPLSTRNLAPAGKVKVTQIVLYNMAPDLQVPAIIQCVHPNGECELSIFYKREHTFRIANYGKGKVEHFELVPD